MKLDGDKQRIVDLPIDGRAKVLAGAGTGKTTALVARYLRFVFDDDVPPGRLLALTFTRRAAAEMQTRIFAEVADRGDAEMLRGLYGAWIMNFHQFAFRVIHDNAPAFGIDPDVTVATAVELQRIRRHLRFEYVSGRIAGIPAEYGADMPSPKGLDSGFDHMMEVVDKARSMLWTPEQLLGYVRADDAEAYRRYLEAIAAVWRAYEAELRRRNLFDFNGLIWTVVDKLRCDERVASRYAAHFDHILVDEFQDTSVAQNELLRIISGGAFDNVTVVGDEKQSIYRWRDACVENIRRFEGPAFPLQTNYRSTQGILDLAYHFIVKDPYFGKHADGMRLTAHDRGEPRPICVFHPEDEAGHSVEQEAQALASWIAALTGRVDPSSSVFAQYAERSPGLAFGDVAILMRGMTASSGLPQYEAALRAFGIPYAIVGGVSVVEERVLRLFNGMMRLLIDPLDVRALLAVLEARPVSMSDRALYEMFSAAGAGAPRKTGANRLTVDGLLDDESLRAVSDPETRERCRTLRNLLGKLGENRIEMDLPAFVVEAMERTQFFYQLFAEGADMRIVESISRRLFDIVEDLGRRHESSLARVVEAVEAIVDGRESAAAEPPHLPADRVAVMTIHQAKGLEFPAVAVPGITSTPPKRKPLLLVEGEGVYASRMEAYGRGTEGLDAAVREQENGYQEERCLLYVAMTRAEAHLFVSSPLPGGIRKKTETLFVPILEALRDHDIACEEQRSIPGGAAGAARIQAPAPSAAPSGDPALEPLLEEWTANRARLEEARAVPAPAPAGLIPVTWRRLAAFRSCPLQYRFRYVFWFEEEIAAGVVDAEDGTGVSVDSPPAVRLPRGMAADEYGRFVHAVFEAWLAGGGTEALLEVSLEAAAARQALAGPVKTRAIEAARRLAEAYRAAPSPRGGRPWRFEWPVECRAGRLLFRGTVDRIDRTADGLRVVDYKIGARQDAYNEQVAYYMWIVKKLCRGAVSGAVCYLHEPVGYVDVDGAKCAWVECVAGEFEAAVAAGCFDAKPGKACEACEYRRICPHAATG